MKEEITFSIDDLKILSAKDDMVILECNIDNDNLSDRCIVYLTRKMFYDIMDIWLNKKSQYYENWNGEFCGVGYIAFNKFEKLNPALLTCDETDYNNDNWVENIKIKQRQVNTFRGIDFEIDMEHG